MNTLKDKVEAFNQLITNDKTVPAMELFYNDEVELQENEANTTTGKQNCIAREKFLLGKFDLALVITKQAIDEINQVVFSEYEMTITDKGNQKVMHRTEISVQQWEKGLVKKEKFYYNEAKPL
ncbi:hypothetical protein [Mucilaginibacter lappiensis]|uniref:SnoaL-like domain-containing protein n=1 Tax=Mucilaginibacter lappiensis TaxID=354630 RepID=A0A1N7DWP1_9SPHI|nr:hypothetical protein [Mucilaginibacter lappiensis]MBB6111489.1 hypothetical protein [Mucilaginibacter lappiensis]MBB6130175.1 hypothetical protein [Mucilaginibacter lappiensis]SIR80135.1 hypothetical protein SAMN05421821_112110 [Mucilaginibacter lappiensis]